MRSVSKVTPASGELVQKDSNRAVLAVNSANGGSQDGLLKPRFRAPNSLIFRFYLFLEGRLWTTFISALTVFALFGDDLRVAVFAMSWDTFFDSVSLLALLAFTTELVVFTIAKPKYFRSFYFYLDILATVTMISDIGFIWNTILEAAFASGTTGNSQEAIDAIQASRVGTKSSRIVRIVRLVRLVRVVKLYKVSNRDNAEDISTENPSLVGKKLSEKTMQRVIAVVLSMLIFVQLFDVGMWTSEAPHGTYGLNHLHFRFQRFKANMEAYGDNFTQYLEDTTFGFKSEIEFYTRGIEGGRLLYFRLHGATDEENAELIQIAKETVWYRWPEEHDVPYMARTSANSDYEPIVEIKSSETQVREELRESEFETSYAVECYEKMMDTLDESNTTCSSYAYFDIRAEVKLAAGLNIIQTIFVMIVLTFGSLMISADAEQLVIRPIERMVRSVQELAENPMGTKNAALPMETTDDDDETVLLQNTIAKIGQLLQIGFGEAGSEIIAKNMSNNAGIEPMCDGVKMEAVFGFCDIRNFTDTTECLQEKVMVYVNRVGAIVHEATHSWYGAANKNIGDAFLLVWKMNDTKRHVDAGNMCDNALVAFLKTMIDLKRENGPGGCLNAYKDHPAIRKRFGENNFEIRLGMGLHIGWAIEGAIGSHYKIDASYLSPNVNMASRLEAATKQFRTPLLLSEDFFDALSSKARKRCRKIDRVTVKGSIQPMGLFTCDIVDFPDTFGEPQYDGKRRLMFDFEGPEMDFIQSSLPENFLSNFSDAVAAYCSGDWAAAKRMLDNVLVEKPGDGPTLSLLSVMEEFDYESPSNWKGYRELTEK
ncbi:Adenylate cyclase, terminal-differentiation specific [Hondaea fermentalgiana]|uniref:Adenylate cyclase, terminal-differentiation specific n=1 Tax=Hondaea fermentalgiana TaxID=2315210 RepID=A0A2R5GNE4_9STRA|nr:Adenylate cyclase, terminal-differentiation specific [Hondaea fermentalgiana]|eukprot:GBG32422.1 Adenylate cyclase, terminal-differentiation specific [Hondaea fermentalgiana]